MKLRDRPILADENVDQNVIAWLRQSGFEVTNAADAGLRGSSDSEILRCAASDRAIVLTHDADFGRLTVADREPFFGLIFVRPGHVNPAHTIGSLQELLRIDPDVTPPFVVVVQRIRSEVSIRIRQLADR